MKKSQLRKIIKEEISKVLKETQLYADFNAESDNSLETRFARTVSEILHIEGYPNEIYISDLYSDGEMRDIKNGDPVYAGPDEVGDFLQTLPSVFTITNNIDGVDESFKITKQSEISFSAEPI
jgi:hypothetical protein